MDVVYRWYVDETLVLETMDPAQSIGPVDGSTVRMRTARVRDPVHRVRGGVRNTAVDVRDRSDASPNTV